MELPFVFDWQPPRITKWDLLRTRWVWLVFIIGSATFTLLFWLHPWVRAADVPSALLSISSTPTDATISVDGHERGQTPVRLELAPGDHQVTVHRAGFVDMTYRLQLASGARASLPAVLWRQQPTVEPLRIPLPGAQVVDAGFLANGRLTLTLSLPPANERQFWLLGPDNVPRSIGPPYAEGAIASTLDGSQLAYLARGQVSLGLSDRLDQLWTTTQHGNPGQLRYVLPVSDERLVDLSWAPDGQHLLVVDEQSAVAGGSRDRLLWLPARDGDPRVLIDLPSKVVAGSYVWSPDGQQVAFLAQSSDHVTLCLLDTRDGSLRDLADLTSSSPPPFAPFTWSADGTRLLYSAAVPASPSLGGWLFGGSAQLALFAVDAAHPLGNQLGLTDAAFATWRDDGSVLGLTRRGSDGRLTLRLFDPDGQSHDLATLPLQSTANFGVRWDVAHGQAIVAIPNTASLGQSHFSYWLVRFQGEAAQ
ncbi:MAG TPA: PEGA domain-containing protein [Chloroflexota bacterium]|nr:PEGA domain-containing protein [Chloroflexota bacterium]